MINVKRFVKACYRGSVIYEDSPDMDYTAVADSHGYFGCVIPNDETVRAIKEAAGSWVPHGELLEKMHRICYNANFVDTSKELTRTGISLTDERGRKVRRIAVLAADDENAYVDERFLDIFPEDTPFRAVTLENGIKAVCTYDKGGMYLIMQVSVSKKFTSILNEVGLNA